MLEQVESKIHELKKQQAEEYYKKKDADLNSWGLTTKRSGNKTTPIIVTDDEYEALIKAANGVGTSGRNSTANLLSSVAVAIIVIGTLGGAAIWAMSDNLGFAWFTLCVLGSLVLALIFRGISEAIRLLQQLIDMKPLVKPDPAHAAAPVQQPVQQMPAAAQGAQYTGQPPIYQAAAYRQPVAQPYYGAPAAPTAPTAPVAPAAPVQQTPAQEAQIPNYGAPQNYNEMPVFDVNIQDDFFSGDHEQPNI